MEETRIENEGLKDAINEAIAANFASLALNFHSEQADLLSRIEAIWQTLTRIDKRLGADCHGQLANSAPVGSGSKLDLVAQFCKNDAVVPKANIVESRNQRRCNSLPSKHTSAGELWDGVLPSGFQGDPQCLAQSTLPLYQDMALCEDASTEVRSPVELGCRRESFSSVVVAECGPIENPDATPSEEPPIDELASPRHSHSPFQSRSPHHSSHSSNSDSDEEDSIVEVDVDVPKELPDSQRGSNKSCSKGSQDLTEFSKSACARRRPSLISTASSSKFPGFASQKDVYSLDALHTDRLLQAQGLTSCSSKRSPSLNSIPLIPPESHSPTAASSRKNSFTKEKPRIRRHSLGALGQSIGHLGLPDTAGANGSAKNDALLQIGQTSVRSRHGSNLKKVSPDNTMHKDHSPRSSPRVSIQTSTSAQNVAIEIKKSVVTHDCLSAQESCSSWSHVGSDVRAAMTKIRSEGCVSRRRCDDEMMDRRYSAGAALNRASRKRHSLRNGMDTLRAEYETMLVKAQELVSDGSSMRSPQEQAEFGWPNWLLAFSGVTPFNERFEGWGLVYLVIMVLIGVLVHSLILSVHETDGVYAHLSSIFYAIGSISALFFLRMQHIENILGPHNRLLDNYACNFEFLDEWRAISRWRLIQVAVLWASMVASRIAIFSGSSQDNGIFGGGGCPAAVGGSHNDGLREAGFILVSGQMAALTFCILHVCCGLEMSVDKFCYRFFEEMHIGKAIEEWNILQAILRRAAATLDSCFLALSTSVMATLLLTGMGVFQGAGNLQDAEMNVQCAVLWCGWLWPPVIMVLFLVFRLASVTEKCCRVPALVNSWSFEASQIDQGRQYVVQYIEHSAAGFYVKGVRLSAFMAFKLGYVMGVVVFTLVIQSMIRHG